MSTTHAHRPTVLTVEQALSLPYATLRLAQLGWRVIRIEPTPIPGRTSKGDPNRYVGTPVAGEDRHSYFIAPNVGKEAIALNLKTREGQAILHRLVRNLRADVFAVNTLPAHHSELGIDYETLAKEKPDLIWCSISAMGIEYPHVPGYDPAIQALVGLMDLTGERDGPPMQSGLPVSDLKAGDEACFQIALALLGRMQHGRGAKIDVSLARSAASWLLTFLPMLDMHSRPDDLRRNGNEHRQFIPVNAYPARDGYVYIAIGSDAQWLRFIGESMFSSLARPNWTTNEGRRETKDALHGEIARVTKAHDVHAIIDVLERALIPCAPISPIEKVWDLPFVKNNQVITQSPDGQTIRLPPPAVSTEYLDGLGRNMPFSPRYGENTDMILREGGWAEADIEQFRKEGVVA